MEIKTFKVEVDGKEIEVVKKEDYDTAVSQLYKEMKEAKEERDDYKKNYRNLEKEIEDYKTDIDNLTSQIDELQKGDDTKEELAKVIADRDNLKKMLEEKENVLGETNNKLKNFMIDSNLKSELAKVVAPQCLDDALMIAKNRVRITDDFKIEIVGDNGEVIRNEKGDPLSLDEYAQQFIKEREHFAKADGGSGSGMNRNSVNAAFSKSWKEMTEAERQSFIKEHSVDEVKQKINETVFSNGG